MFSVSSIKTQTKFGQLYYMKSFEGMYVFTIGAL